MKTTRQFWSKTCSIFIVCFSIFMGVTSCSSDDFESYGPEEKKMTDAELVEWALAQMPQSRANAPTPVTMVTTEEGYFSMYLAAKEDMVINWGDNTPPTPIIGDNIQRTYQHYYNDGQPAHSIYFIGTNQAITYLSVNFVELIYLDITNNTELEQLLCGGNRLNLLDLTNCPNLQLLAAHENQLSFINVANLPRLYQLQLNSNNLTSINLFNNIQLTYLLIGNNPMTSIDLTHNFNLRTIDISGLSISTMDFSIFPNLSGINVSSTLFTSLDLSNNPAIHSIYMNNNAITQLDISNLRLRNLHAANSALQSINCTKSNLEDLLSVEITNSDFEENLMAMFDFLNKLPDRRDPWRPDGIIRQGVFQTNSSLIPGTFTLYLTNLNWTINPY